MQALYAQPSVLDFGVVNVGESVTLPVTVRLSSMLPTGFPMPATFPVTIGTTGAPFSTSASGMQNLKGGFFTFFVTCAPAATGGSNVVTGSITVTSPIMGTDFGDAFSNVTFGPLTIDFSAYVFNEKLLLTPNADTLDYGMVEYATGMRTMHLKLTADTSSTYPITFSASISGDSAFSCAGLPLTDVSLLPGASQILDIVFAPQSLGNKTATLTLTSSAPNLPSAAVSLVGVGANYFDYVTDEYALDDGSLIRAHIQLRYNGTPPNDQGPNLSSNGVHLSDPGSHDMQTDLSTLVTYPAAITFKLVDQNDWLSMLLMDDENCDTFVGGVLERSTDGGATWVTEVTGNVDASTQNYDPTPALKELSVTITPNVDVLDAVPYRLLFGKAGDGMSAANEGVQLDPESVMTRQGYVLSFTNHPGVAKAAGAHQIWWPLSGQSALPGTRDLTLLDILKWVFALTNYCNTDSETFDPLNAPALTCNYDPNAQWGYPYTTVPLVVYGGALNVQWVDPEKVEQFAYGVQDNGANPTLKDFIRSLAYAYGFRVEVYGPGDVRIQQMFYPDPNNIVTIDDDSYVKLTKSYNVAPITALAVFGGNNNGVTPDSSPYTMSAVWGIPDQFDYTNKQLEGSSFLYKAFSASRGSLKYTSDWPSMSDSQKSDRTLQIVAVQMRKDYPTFSTLGYSGSYDTQWVYQSVAAARFWWHYLAAKRGNNVYKVTLPGLDYAFNVTVEYRGDRYFPLRRIKHYKDMTTEFELVRVMDGGAFPSPFSSTVPSSVPTATASARSLQATVDAQGNPSINVQTAEVETLRVQNLVNVGGAYQTDEAVDGELVISNAGTVNVRSVQKLS